MSPHFRILRPFLSVVFSAVGLLLSISDIALADRVDITNYGHSALLIKGGGYSVLLNPFRAVGCASGLKEPRVNADVILASSELADEGARVAEGIFLVNPGSYRIGTTKFEGFAISHDRLGGRRFGQATIWQWNQAGLNFAHLGGSAAPLTREAKILLGRPDVLIIAVGGGAKVYDGEEAAEVVRFLNPKQVIPVQYLSGKTPVNCDLTGIQPFLNAMKGIEVRQVDKNFDLSPNNADETVIHVMQ